jgi:hypothetical protein
MPYYPKSQITTNLNTNGGELSYIDGREYMGYYWKNSRGQFFTGKTPQDTPTEKLIEITYNEDNFLSEKPSSVIAIFSDDPDPIMPYYNGSANILKYTLLQNINLSKTVFLPYYSPNIPTEQDYQIREYRRYFCKKTNEIIYLEISKETYDKLLSQDPQIAFQLYLPFNLPWQLTGKKEDVYKTNRNITELTSVKLKLPMLSSYLKEDFTKYYRG